MIHGYHHIRRTYITPTPETTSTHDTWLPSYTPDVYHTDPWDNKHTWYMVTIIYAGRISCLPLRQQAHMIHGYHHIRRMYITPTPETTSTHDTWLPSYTPDVYHTDPWDNKHTWYMVTTIYAGRISHRPLRQQAHMIHGYHHIRRTYITPTPETTSTHDTWLPSYTPDVYHTDPRDNKHTWYMVTIIYAGRISHRPLRQQAHMIHGYHHIRRTYITPTPETTSTHDTWLPSYTPDVYHTDPWDNKHTWYCTWLPPYTPDVYHAYPWDNKHTWYMVTIIYAGRISCLPLRQQAHMIHGYHHIRRTYITPTPETTSTHDTWLPSYTPDVYHTYPWDNKHTWYMVTTIYARHISHMVYPWDNKHTWLPSYTPDVYHTDPSDNKHTWYMVTIIYAGRISHLPLRQQAHMIHGYHHIRRTYITPTLRQQAHMIHGYHHISRTYITPTPETTSTHDTWLPPYTPDVYHTDPWDNKHTWYMVTTIYAGRISRLPLRQQAHMIHGYHHIRRTYITPTPETTSTHDTWLPPYKPDVYHAYPWDNKHTWYMVTTIYAGRISHLPLRQQAHMIHGYHHISRTYITLTPETTSTHDTWLPSYTPDVYHTYPWDNKLTWYMVTIIYAGRISHLPLRQQAHMIHDYHHIRRTYITPTPETTSTHDTWLPSYTPDVYHTYPWDNKHTWYMAVFEIALVRDKWLFTRTSKQSVSSYPSDKWKFTTIFFTIINFYYNAVIERQNAKDFTLENRQRSRCYLMSQKWPGFDLFGTSVICWIAVVHTLVQLLWLYIIDDEGVIY